MTSVTSRLPCLLLTCTTVLLLLYPYISSAGTLPRVTTQLPPGEQHVNKPTTSSNQPHNAPPRSGQNRIELDQISLSLYLQQFSGLEDPRDIYPDYVVQPTQEILGESQVLENYVDSAGDYTLPQPQTAGPVDIIETLRNATQSYHQDYFVDIEDLLKGLEEGGNVPRDLERSDSEDDDLEDDLEEDLTQGEDQGYWYNSFSYNSNSEAGTVTTETGQPINSTFDTEVRPTPYYRTQTEETRQNSLDYDNNISLDIQPGYTDSIQATTADPRPAFSQETVTSATSRVEPGPTETYSDEYGNNTTSYEADPGWRDVNNDSALITATGASATGSYTERSVLDLELSSTTTATQTATQEGVVSTEIPGETEQVTTQTVPDTTSTVRWTDGVNDSTHTGDGDEGGTSGDDTNTGHVTPSGTYPDITTEVTLHQTNSWRDSLRNDKDTDIYSSSNDENTDRNLFPSSTAYLGLVKPNDRNRANRKEGARNNGGKKDKLADDAERWNKGIILGSTLTIAGVILIGIMITLCCACVRREEKKTAASVTGNPTTDADDGSEDSYGFNSSAQRKSGGRISGSSLGDYCDASPENAGLPPSKGYDVGRGGGDLEIGEAHEIPPQKSTNVFASAFNSLTWKRKDKKKNKKTQINGNHGDSEGVSVKDRVKAFEGSSGGDGGQDESKPRKKKPQSKAFEEFENSGLIIGFDHDDNWGNPRKSKPATSAADTQDAYHTDFPGFHISDGHADDDHHQQSSGFFSSGTGAGSSSNERVNSEGDGSMGSTNEYRIQSKCQESNTSISLSSASKLTEDEGIHTMDSEAEEDDFSNAVPRQTEILKSFRRAPPPRNRGKSHRPTQKKSPLRETSTFDDTDVREVDENEEEPPLKNVSQINSKYSTTQKASQSNEESTHRNIVHSRDKLNVENQAFKGTRSVKDKDDFDRSDRSMKYSSGENNSRNGGSNPGLTASGSTSKSSHFVTPANHRFVKSSYGNLEGHVTTSKERNVNPNRKESILTTTSDKSSFHSPASKDNVKPAKTGVVNPISRESVKVSKSSYVNSRDSVKPVQTGIVNPTPLFRNIHSTQETTAKQPSYKSTLSWKLNTSTTETPSENIKKLTHSKTTNLQTGPTWTKRNYDLTEDGDKECSPPPPLPLKSENTKAPGAQTHWWGAGGTADTPGRGNPPPPREVDPQVVSEKSTGLYRYKAPELGEPPDNNNVPITGPNLKKPTSDISASRYTLKEGKQDKLETVNNNNPQSSGYSAFEAEATFSNQGGNYSFYTPNPLEQDSDEDKPHSQSKGMIQDSSSQWSHDQSCDNRSHAEFGPKSERSRAQPREATTSEAGGALAGKPISGLGQSAEVTYKPFYTRSSNEKAYHRQTSVPTYPYGNPTQMHGITATNTRGQPHMHGPTETTHRSQSYTSPSVQQYSPTPLAHVPPTHSPNYRVGQSHHTNNNEVTGRRGQLHGTAPYSSSSSVIPPSASLIERLTYERTAADDVFEDNRQLPSNQPLLSNTQQNTTQTSYHFKSGANRLPSPVDISYHSNQTSPMDTSYPSSNPLSPASPLSDDGLLANASYHSEFPRYGNQRQFSSGSPDAPCDPTGSLGFTSTKSRGSSLKFNMEFEGTSV